MISLVRTYWVACAVFGLIVLHGLILYFMGQPVIYKEGYIKLWHGVVQSSENSQHISDWYTFSHIIHGFLFFWILLPMRRWLSVPQRLFLAMGIEMGWEILENTNFIIDRYREATIALDYYGDSILNSVSDLIAATLGYLAAARMRWWVILGLILVMEIVVGYIIRDNLLLNIIMLVSPSEAIKAWQSSV
ncbi:MAG: hypothetical protein RI911_902 [Candidatus Parcubacteria bacterium]